MIRPPVVESVGENYVVIEPVAGMLKLINNRVEQIKKLESKLVMMDYSSVLVLVCLHTQHTDTDGVTIYKSVAVKIATELNQQYLSNAGTLRGVFADISEEDFIKIVNEFQFTYPRDVIDSVFNKIDQLCFFTAKKVEDEKKD